MLPCGVIRPILLAARSVNHRFPSPPVEIRQGLLAAVGMGNSARSPVRLILPILLAPRSVNQRLPSGPATMPPGIAPTASGNSLIAPVGEMRPILFPASSVNQRLPSGAAVIPLGALLLVGTANSAIGGGATVAAAADIAARPMRPPARRGAPRRACTSMCI